MKVSISAATLKRLAVLERGRSAARTLGRWPVILDPDTWERGAMAHQDKLCADTEAHLVEFVRNLLIANAPPEHPLPAATHETAAGREHGFPDNEGARSSGPLEAAAVLGAHSGSGLTLWE